MHEAQIKRTPMIAQSIYNGVHTLLIACHASHRVPLFSPELDPCASRSLACKRFCNTDGPRTKWGQLQSIPRFQGPGHADATGNPWDASVYDMWRAWRVDRNDPSTGCLTVVDSTDATQEWIENEKVFGLACPSPTPITEGVPCPGTPPVMVNVRVASNNPRPVQGSYKAASLCSSPRVSLPPVLEGYINELLGSASFVLVSATQLRVMINYVHGPIPVSRASTTDGFQIPNFGTLYTLSPTTLRDAVLDLMPGCPCLQYRHTVIAGTERPPPAPPVPPRPPGDCGHISERCCATAYNEYYTEYTPTSRFTSPLSGCAAGSTCVNGICV
jgi:hypothetical protein